MIDKHITEEHLERFLRAPEKLTQEEHGAINTHLTRCRLCEEHLQALQGFYADLEERLQEGPTERDGALAETLLLRKAIRLLPSPGLLKKQMGSLLEKVWVAVEPYPPPLPRRILRYIVAHPVRTAGVTTLAALALMAAFLILPPANDVNPAYAKIENYTLSVYNKTGEVLWTKSALGMPDISSENLWENRRRFILVDNIDGHGANEVLLTGVSNSALAQDTLYCFNSDGTLRWKHGLGSIIAFGEMDFIPHSRWYFYDFFVLANQATGKSRLFVLAHITPYFPSKLLELDPASGLERQSYWHPGHLEEVLTHDIDLDGRNEIILGGINNIYKRACIAVLHPANIGGYGPVRPKSAPENLPKGQEEYYLLFPLTQLGQTSGDVPYNVVGELELNRDGSITVLTEEAPNTDIPGGILYTIVPGMKVVAATGSDPFLKSHQRLVAEGKLQEKLGPEYWEELKNSVRYWDGERFVYEATGNAWYFGERKLP